MADDTVAILAHQLSAALSTVREIERIARRNLPQDEHICPEDLIEIIEEHRYSVRPDDRWYADYRRQVEAGR